MAARTAFSYGITVIPARRHAPRSFRLLGTLLVALAFAIAIGVPLLLSGITGFNLWLGEGKSMEPTFYAGDFVITRDVPASDLRPGDVVLFEDKGHHVMHRIVSITPGAAGDAILVTRGDNNVLDDEPVAAGVVEGKLVYDLSWLPRVPLDLSGTGLFVAEWLLSVLLLTAGILLRRDPARPHRAPAQRPYAFHA
jgi:signal peptidase I